MRRGLFSVLLGSVVLVSAAGCGQGGHSDLDVSVFEPAPKSPGGEGGSLPEQALVEISGVAWGSEGTPAGLSAPSGFGAPAQREEAASDDPGVEVEPDADPQPEPPVEEEEDSGPDMGEDPSTEDNACQPETCPEPGRGVCVLADDGSASCQCDPGHLDRGGQCLAAELEVRVVDVGHGDAILLQVADYEVLVDAGQPTSHARQRLGEALGAVRGALELFIVTHPHNDHVGGAAFVLETVEVEELVTNGETRDIGACRDLRAQIEEDGVTPSAYTPGDRIEPLPGLVLEFLATGGVFPDTEVGRDINNDSVVLMVSWAGTRVMLTGDIEESAGDALVERYCPEEGRCPALEADVLKVPHHGSAHQSLAFLHAVAPTHAIISAGFEDRRYHLPRLGIVRELRDGLGAAVHSTSAPGDDDVVLTIDSAGAVGGESAPSVFAWERDSEGQWQGLVVSGAVLNGT